MILQKRSDTRQKGSDPRILIWTPQDVRRYAEAIVE